ncbi:MAG: DUF5615 family PIN-like protein [Candidatus Omnitrophota bacterium]
MAFLVDENVSFGLIEKLNAKGYEVISVVENQQQGISDSTVFEMAKKVKAVIITRDHHFTNSLLFPAEETGGVIHLRHGNLSSEEEIKLVEDFLTRHSLDQYRGKLVLLSKNNIFIR